MISNGPSGSHETRGDPLTSTSTASRSPTEGVELSAVPLGGASAAHPLQRDAAGAPDGRSVVDGRRGSGRQGGGSSFRGRREPSASVRSVVVQNADNDWGAGMGLSSSSDGSSEGESGKRNRRWAARAEAGATQVDADLDVQQGGDLGPRRKTLRSSGGASVVEVQMANHDWGAGMGLSSSSGSSDEEAGRRNWRRRGPDVASITSRVDADLRPPQQGATTSMQTYSTGSSAVLKQAEGEEEEEPSTCGYLWARLMGRRASVGLLPPRQGSSRDTLLADAEAQVQRRRKARKLKAAANPPPWLSYTSRLRFAGGVALHVLDFIFRVLSLFVYWREGVIEALVPLLVLQTSSAFMAAYITFHDTDILMMLEWSAKRFKCCCERHLHCCWCIFMSVAFLLFGCCQWIQVKRAWARQVHAAEVITDMGNQDERATTAGSLPPFAEGERIMPVALITGVPFLIINWIYDTRVQSQCLWVAIEDSSIFGWLAPSSILTISSGLLLFTVTLGILEIDVVISSYVMKRYHLNPSVLGSRAGQLQWLYPVSHVLFRASEAWMRIALITGYYVVAHAMHMRVLLLGYVVDYAVGVMLLYNISPRKEGLAVHLLAGVGLLVADLTYFIDQPNYTAPARRIRHRLAYWRFFCFLLTFSLVAWFKWFLTIESDGQNSDPSLPSCLQGDASFHFWVLLGSAIFYYGMLRSPMISKIGDDLHTAASAGNLQRVKKLLTPDQNGQVLDVNALTKDYCGMTPLMLASGGGHANVIEELARAGAAINLRSALGETSLHLAARGRHLAAIESLIEHGANTWEQNNEGMTPLKLLPAKRSSFDAQHAEIVRILEPRHRNSSPMEATASMEAGSYDNSSPGYYAVSAAPIGAVQLREYFPDALLADDDVPSPRSLHSVSALVVSRAAGGLARRVLERRHDDRTDSASQVPLGALKIMGELGKGGFGRVIKVELPRDMGGGLWRWRQRPLCYALKLQLKHESNQAYSEVLALRRLDHPFIVRLERAFQTAKHFALLLEFCPTDLNRVLCKRDEEQCLGLPPKRAAKYMGQVLLALTHLHEKEEVVYRDVKPENILISEQDDAKLTDFGLAKKMTSADRMTMCGTVGYMPPELGALGTPRRRASSDDAVDGDDGTPVFPRLDPYKMDAYSYGITLQVTLLGEDGARRKTVRRKGPMMLPLHLTELENTTLLKQLRDNGRMSQVAYELLELLLRHDPQERESLIDVRDQHSEFFVTELDCKTSLQDHLLKPAARSPTHVTRIARDASEMRGANYRTI